MHLFLIASAPISYVYVLTLRSEFGKPGSRAGVAALRGVFAGLVEILVLLVLSRFIPRVYSGFVSYFHSALFDYGLPVVGTFLLFMWFTPRLRSYTAAERRLSLLSFAAGAMTVVGVMDLFIFSDYMGIYELFLLPALRVSAMLMMPVFYKLSAEETFWIRFLYIAAIFSLPLLFAGIFLLDVLNIAYAAVTAATLLLAASWAVTIVGAAKRAGGRA